MSITFGKSVNQKLIQEAEAKIALDPKFKGAVESHKKAETGFAVFKRLTESPIEEQHRKLNTEFEKGAWMDNAKEYKALESRLKVIEKLLVPRKKSEVMDPKALNLLVADLDYIKAVCKYLKDNAKLDKKQSENVDKLVNLVEAKLNAIKRFFEVGGARAEVSLKGSVTVLRSERAEKEAAEKKAKFQERVKEFEPKFIKGKERQEKLIGERDARLAAAKQELREAVKLQKGEVAKKAEAKALAEAKAVQEKWKKPKLSREEELESLGFGKPNLKQVGQELNRFVSRVRKEIDLNSALGKWFGASSTENIKLKKLLEQDFAALNEKQVVASGREVVELIGKALSQKGKTFAEIPDDIKESAKKIRQDLDILQHGREMALVMKNERAEVEFGLKKTELAAAMSVDKRNQIKRSMQNLLREFEKHESVLMEKSGLVDVFGNVGNRDENAYIIVKDAFNKANAKQLQEHGEALLAFIGEKLEKVGLAEKINNTFIVKKSVPRGAEDLTFFYDTALEQIRGIAAPGPVVRAQHRLDEALQYLVDVAQSDVKNIGEDTEKDDFLRIDITKMKPNEALEHANKVMEYMEDNVSDYYDLIETPDGRTFAKIKQEYLHFINAYRQAIVALVDLSDFTE